MARKPRVDYPGAWHHVFHRGARHEPIFVDDSECILFMDTIHEAVERLGLEVHAYALIPNHYHLLVRVPLGNLSAVMKYINGSYTQRINARKGWDGPLFRGRFGSTLIGDEAWLSHLVAYIHLNPVKAGLVHRLDEPCWTSHRAYLALEPTPSWLSTEFMLDRFGGLSAMADFVKHLHIGRAPWPAALNTAEGWLRPAKLLPTHGGTQRTAVEPMSFESVLDRVGRICGMTAEQVLKVRRGPGGNPARRFLIWALRYGGMMRQSEVAGLLHMSAGHVSRVLARLRENTAGAPITEWQAQWSAIEADALEPK